MKKLITMFAMFVLLVFNVSAADYLTEENIPMAMVDSKVVQYCIEGWEPTDTDIPVEVEAVCQDVDGQYGCNGLVDVMDPSYFTVSILSPLTVIGADGCTDVTVTTNIQNPGEEGIFYFTVGDATAGSPVSQTGKVSAVPEFGVLASISMLGLAGLYIAKKRRN